MNKKLIALFVAVATVLSISAHRNEYDNDYDYDREYDNDYDYDRHDRRRFRPVRDTARETGHVVRRTGEEAGHLAEETVKTPGRILFGRD